MSFLAIIEKGAKDIGLFGTLATPFISAVNPAAGAISGLVTSSVIQAETLFPADKTGQMKKEHVMGDIQAALPLLQAGLQIAGKNLTMTPELQAALSSLVDNVVAMLNNLAVLKTAIK